MFRLRRALVTWAVTTVATAVWARRRQLLAFARGNRVLDGALGRVPIVGPWLRSPTGGASTLLEVLDVAERTGYATQFVHEAGGVRCGACSTTSSPAQMRRSWVHRLEGASDPDDALTVSALECPSCGAKGTLVLPYGPSADADEGDVSRELRQPTNQDMAPVGTP